jgi:hypothetical protein
MMDITALNELAMVARAFDLADEAMLNRLYSYCMCDGMRLIPLTEHVAQAYHWDDVDPEIREAADWLIQRGKIAVIPDANGRPLIKVIEP